MITESGQMQKIKMVRGYHNRFYFVENDQKSNTDVVYVLELKKDKCWRWTKRPIFDAYNC